MADTTESGCGNRHHRAILPLMLFFMIGVSGLWHGSAAQQLYRVDRDILRFIESNNGSPLLDYPVELFSLATPLVEGGVIVERSFSGWRRNDRQSLQAGAVAAAGILASQALVVALKYVVRRRRPPRDETSYRPRIWDVRTTPSFPSGHAASSFAFAAAMGRAYPRWRIWLLAYATASGLAQIYVGNHYPSDVLAGALLGYAVSTLVWNHRRGVLRFISRAGVVKSADGWRATASIPF